MTSPEAARERLKQVPGLVPVVRSARRARISAGRSIVDARLFASRLGRNKRIAAYLRANSVRRLQLGSGSNVYEGWLNTDVVDFKRKNEIVYLDATKPFPLPDAAFDAVFSEHMIEHLTYEDGIRCLAECHRVLRAGGRIRVATPSLDRLITLCDAEQSDLQGRYIRWSIDSFQGGAVPYLPGFVVNNFFRDWGHQFIYDRQTLGHALESVGFVDVEEWPVGESGDQALVGLERHMRSAAEFNAFETMVLEARRPR
jgi:predicted SAM-dependent methyltransferase